MSGLVSSPGEGSDVEMLLGPRNPGSGGFGVWRGEGIPRGIAREGRGMARRVIKNRGGREEQRGTAVMMRDVKDGRALQPGMEDHEESGLWERGHGTEGQ